MNTLNLDTINYICGFLGWCTILNIVLFCYMAVMLIAFNAPIKRLHSRIMLIPKEQLNGLYFSFLAHYKLAILILNLVPYCAMKIMAQ